MKQILLPATMVVMAGLAACTHSTVDIKPIETKSTIEVQPIHVVIDVNIRVDKQLDNFFAFEDQFRQPATQPAGGKM